MKALAEVIAKSFDEERREGAFQDFIEAAQAFRAAKEDGWDAIEDDERAELRCRYTVLVNVCYAAGYTTGDTSPYWPPIG